MAVTLVGTVNIAPTTNVTNTTVTLPTVQDNDWLILFVMSNGTASGAISSTNTGTMAATLTQIGTLQNTSGLTHTAWKAKLTNSGDSGQTCKFVFGGSLPHVMAGVVLRGCDTTDAVDGSSPSIGGGLATGVTTPSLTTVAANCAEVSAAVLNISPGNTLTTATAPSPLTKQVTALQTTNAALSQNLLSVGTNLTGVSAGASIGSRAWTTDSSVTGVKGSWTVAIKPAVVATTPTVAAGSDQNIATTSVNLSGTVTANSGTITSASWTCTARPIGASAPTVTTSGSTGGTSGTFTSTVTVVPGVYTFHLASTNSSSLSSSDDTDIYVAPSGGGDSTILSEISGAYVKVGSATDRVATVNDTDNASYLESDPSPANMAERFRANPVAMGPISVLVTEYQNPSSPVITWTMNLYAANGSTLLYTDTWAAATTATEHTSIWTGADASLTTLAARQGLVVEVVADQ